MATCGGSLFDVNERALRVESGEDTAPGTDCDATAASGTAPHSGQTIAAGVARRS
ncbi:MAG: hypothetical protein MK077_09980 [Phycisphaerales bacterium]|nr:hypothetical protein [Phycisphaerales bacterium]